jgi:hypothetical protein
MNNPARHFGLLSRDRAGSLCGVDFLRGIMDGRYPAPPFSEVADVWPVSVEVGRIVFEAAPSHSALQPGQAFATIDMTASFVRPVSERTGTPRAEGILLHLGSRMASAEGKLFDPAGRLVAHGSENCAITAIGSGDAERRR